MPRLQRPTFWPLPGVTTMQLLIRRSQRYLAEGRLPDVLALIQVLALDDQTHRSEQGLQSELQGAPQSAIMWTEVAKSHPEFFRVKPDGEHRVSLVARHVAPKNEDGVHVLPSEFVGRLLSAAIDLHDRQVRLAERWTLWLPLWVAVIIGFFSLAAVLLRGYFHVG